MTIIKEMPKLDDVEVDDLLKLEDRALVEVACEWALELSREPVKHSMYFVESLLKSKGKLYIVMYYGDHEHGISDCIHAGYTPEIYEVSAKEVTSIKLEIVDVPE